MTTTKDEAIKILRDALEYYKRGGDLSAFAIEALAATSHIAPDAAAIQAEPVPTDLWKTQAYRTGYGQGVRKAAQMMEDRDLPVMAELIRNLQSTSLPAASEAVGVPDAYMVVWKGEPVDLYFQKFNAEQKVRSMDAEASIVPLRSILAAPAAPTDAKPDDLGDQWHSLTCDGTCSPSCENATTLQRYVWAGAPEAPLKHLTAHEGPFYACADVDALKSSPQAPKPSE